VGAAFAAWRSDGAACSALMFCAREWHFGDACGGACPRTRPLWNRPATTVQPDADAHEALSRTQGSLASDVSADPHDAPPAALGATIQGCDRPCSVRNDHRHGTERVSAANRCSRTAPTQAEQPHCVASAPRAATTLSAQLDGRPRWRTRPAPSPTNSRQRCTRTPALGSPRYGRRTFTGGR
jgi:hypothetical protein